jgi:hypothetical protein
MTEYTTHKPGQRYKSPDTRGTFEATGEKRPPKAGEFYLSGAIIEAYRASKDMTAPYLIARRVAATTGVRVIQSNYPAGIHGWEDVSEYPDTTRGRQDARRDLREYKTAQPDLMHRIISRRVPT